MKHILKFVRCVSTFSKMFCAYMLGTLYLCSSFIVEVCEGTISWLIIAAAAAALFLLGHSEASRCHQMYCTICHPLYHGTHRCMDHRSWRMGKCSSLQHLWAPALHTLVYTTYNLLSKHIQSHLASKLILFSYVLIPEQVEQND